MIIVLLCPLACPFGVVGLWAMRCCGVSGAGVAVETNGGGAGGAWQRAGADAVAAPGAAGFGGRLAHRVLHGVDVLFGHRAAGR